MKPKSGLTRFHNCYILRDSEIIKEDLWIRDGKIENPECIFYVEQLEADVTINCDDLLIAPGFIDIQINGKFISVFDILYFIKFQESKLIVFMNFLSFMVLPRFIYFL